MENYQVILIVFGSSGFIVIMLVFVFRWMSIRIFSCTKKSNLYKIERNHSSSSEHLEDIKDCNKYNSLDGSNTDVGATTTISLNTAKNSFDFSNIFKATNGDCLITQTKPMLKQTVRDYSTYLIENESNEVGSSIGKLEIEINYNAFEEYLEVKVIQANDLLNDYVKLNDLTPLDATKNSTITESNSVYFIIWLNDEKTESQKSQIKYLSNRIIFDSKFRWLTDDASIMKIQVNILMYTIDHQTGIESVLNQTSIKVGDVYMYQPVGLWLSLQDPEDVPMYMGEILLSLSYLPTAERLTAVIVEARNLQFENNIAFGDSYVKISLINESTTLSYRTSVRKSNPNPQFNEFTVFKLSTRELNQVSLNLIVYEVNGNGGEDIQIGYVNINPSSNKDSSNLCHMQQIVKRVRRQISTWYPIKKNCYHRFA